MTDIKAQVKTQFGRAAAGYATSIVHAQGESLSVLAELIQPQADWQALDVATGAGHTALLFAPQVAHMIATDLTPEMINKTAELAARQGLTQVETRLADAEALPFEANSFDLVTCRIALHHFPHPRQAMAEWARVLKPGGVLGFTDNTVMADNTAIEYYNAYEKLRDPSHHWVYSTPELQSMLTDVGLTVEATRLLSKELEFHDWADRMSVSPANKEALLRMMRHIPSTLEPMLHPRWTDNTMYFSLWEVVLVARK